MNAATWHYAELASRSQYVVARVGHATRCIDNHLEQRSSLERFGWRDRRQPQYLRAQAQLAEWCAVRDPARSRRRCLPMALPFSGARNHLRGRARWLAAPVSPPPIFRACGACHPIKGAMSVSRDRCSTRYPLADFHDVASGNNGGVSAGAGYDFVTGRASIILSSAINHMRDVNGRRQYVFQTPRRRTSRQFEASLVDCSQRLPVPRRPTLQVGDITHTYIGDSYGGSGRAQPAPPSICGTVREAVRTISCAPSP